MHVLVLREQQNMQWFDVLMDVVIFLRPSLSTSMIAVGRCVGASQK